MLKCKGFTINQKESEIEIILNKCKTSPKELSGIMNKYNQEIQKQEEPGLQKDVNVYTFYKDNKIFGCNREHDAYFNPFGIYFFGIVEDDQVVFEFSKENMTEDWLLDFCIQYIRSA